MASLPRVRGGMEVRSRLAAALVGPLPLPVSLHTSDPGISLLASPERAVLEEMLQRLCPVGPPPALPVYAAVDCLSPSGQAAGPSSTSRTACWHLLGLGRLWQ